MLQHYALSTIIAVIAFYCLQKIGTDYLLFKGFVFGLAVYFLVYGWLAKTVIPVEVLQPDLATSVVYLLGNLIYGITMTICLAKFRV